MQNSPMFFIKDEHMAYENEKPLTNGPLCHGQGTWLKVIILMEITHKVLKVIKPGNGSYS